MPRGVPAVPRGKYKPRKPRTPKAPGGDLTPGPKPLRDTRPLYGSSLVGSSPGFLTSRKFPPMPGWFSSIYPAATEPEWAIYWALTHMGLDESIDFIFQSPVLGGRTFGGFVVDIEVYIFHVGIAVQGEYWHYQRGPEQIENDRLEKARYESVNVGWIMVFIDALDAVTDPTYFTQEAIDGYDHSYFSKIAGVI